MNLSYLMQFPGFRGETDWPVGHITDNPGDIDKNSIFVIVNNGVSDVKTLTVNALQKGAVYVLGEQELNVPGYIRVPDARLSLAMLHSAYCNHPSQRLKVIGITGTNGKTTTAYYIKHLLECLGKKCGVIGTLGNDVGNGESIKSGYTTPTPATLYNTLDKMVQNGCEYCAMEVSSQALDQRRADGIQFKLGIYTNLSEEHTDYHKNPDDYIEAKSRLCSLSEKILVNADDAYAEAFCRPFRGKEKFYYSAKGCFADFMAKNIRFMPERTEFLYLNQTRLKRVTLPAIGEFSVYNALSAGAALLTEGFDFYEMCEALETLPMIPGRAQILHLGGIRICIDFAHTPFALGQILLALRQTGKGRLITVFGCGGNRDRAKRPLMGLAAANTSDCVILTNDNPRNESPQSILQDIKSGIKRRTDVFVIENREEAIRFAVNKANPGDTVLIAGKGHEDTVEQNGEKTYFSDYDCIDGIFGLN